MLLDFGQISQNPIAKLQAKFSATSNCYLSVISLKNLTMLPLLTKLLQ